ncbi:hypothetical protein [Pseudomonas putida]|uniref:hypothetical protein n=1 Tax=Pseudomonas putida TaxID=303 RepID=UPI004046B4A4
MDKSPDKLPFDATKLFEALQYQLVVALEYCYKLEKGKRLWIEVYGDVTLEDVVQVEVKLYADTLRDGHQNIWNTINNWLHPAFDHRAYEGLMLVTNQRFSARSTLKDWNISTAAEKHALLAAIYEPAEKKFAASSGKEPSEGLALQRSVMDPALKDDLLEILDKVEFLTGSPSLQQRIHDFKVRHLKAIRESKHQSFIDDILGFIGSTKYIQAGWEITCEEFTAKVAELTKRYMPHSSIFPEVDADALEQKIDLDQIADRPFVKKIREIDGDRKVQQAALHLLIAGEVIDQLYADSLASPFDIQRYQKNHLNRHKDGREGAMFDCIGETCPTQLKHKSMRFFFAQHSAPIVKLNTFEDTTTEFRNGIYHMLADVKADKVEDEFYWRLWDE